MTHTSNSLLHLIEECAELQQALCKAERFGWFNFHPTRPNSNNLEDVKAEMDDVVEAIEKMQETMRELEYVYYRALSASKETPNDDQRPNQARG